mmetsp:Transcript_5106/g.7423  ORF Transcript_5106/g.7423 Transcript_5106/m.7423 type:complete len:123 (-) Transcript_5106:69-437(-)
MSHHSCQFSKAAKSGPTLQSTKVYTSINREKNGRHSFHSAESQILLAYMRMKKKLLLTTLVLYSSTRHESRYTRDVKSLFKLSKHLFQSNDEQMGSNSYHRRNESVVAKRLLPAIIDEIIKL